MNLVLTETDGTHIAVIMGVTEAALLPSLDNIIYAVESHIDKKIDETTLTEKELEDCFNNPWGLNREYIFTIYTHYDNVKIVDTRVFVNIQVANVLY